MPQQGQGRAFVLSSIVMELIWTLVAVSGSSRAYPIVVIKLDVKESSEKRSSRQLFPTPALNGAISLMSVDTGHIFQACKPRRRNPTTVPNEQELDKIVVVLPTQ